MGLLKAASTLNSTCRSYSFAVFLKACSVAPLLTSLAIAMEPLPHPRTSIQCPRRATIVSINARIDRVLELWAAQNFSAMRRPLDIATDLKIEDAKVEEATAPGRGPSD